MPGSPPISVAEPGTKPPPATRSSSLIPVTMRATGLEAPDRLSSGNGRPTSPLRAAAPADAERRRFLDDGVPLAASFALARPALRDRAAILADVGGATGHGDRERSRLREGEVEKRRNAQAAAPVSKDLRHARVFQRSCWPYAASVRDCAGTVKFLFVAGLNQISCDPLPCLHETRIRPRARERRVADRDCLPSGECDFALRT